MAARSRRWLPGLLVASAVIAVASSAGAQVDPGEPLAVWSDSCVTPGPNQLVVYGRGWDPGAVAITVGQEGAPATAVESGVFQARISISITAPAAEEPLTLTATQGAKTATHQIRASGSCRPTVAAAVGGPACAAAGQLVPVNLTVEGATAGTYRHYVDLFGPAESVNRFQPTVTSGSYTLTLVVRNVPGRIVPATVETRTADGLIYATTDVTLPRECTGQVTTTSTAPPTTAAGATATPTTAPATTAAPTTAPATTLPPFVAPPGFGFAPATTSLSVSPALGEAGQATTVAGTGFGPSATVVLRWRPGIGQWTVTAGGDGSFRTQVLVLPDDVEGPRLLEAVGPVSASASYLVVPSSQQPAFGGIFVRG